MDLEYLASLAESFRPWAVPAATLIGALAAARITWHFGSIQAGIAKQQAATAALAADTARNKLKLELFEKRLEVYKVFQEYIEFQLNTSTQITAAQAADDEFERRAKAVEWLFDWEIERWAKHELMRDVADYRDLMLEWLNRPDPHAGGQRIVSANALAESSLYSRVLAAHGTLQDQRSRLDQLFTPYLKLTH